MNLVLLGWLRPVLARNADRRQRLRPSVPTAKSDSRICDKVVRSCFNPLPPLDAFTAHRDQPQLWVVEGREEVTTSGGETRTVTYGLWFVDVETGAITPSDRLAQNAAADSTCFKER